MKKTTTHFRIAVLPGDGIGKEVTAQSLKVLHAIAETNGYRFDCTEALIGAAAIDATGTALPQKTIEICLASDAVLFGAVGDPKYDHDPEAKVRPEQGILGIRKALQLYANVRPVKAYPSLHQLSPLRQDRLSDIDFVIYRELTGGIYFGEKCVSDDGNTASDTCIYTREEVERIARQALEHAARRRKKLTLVDKANVLETSRLWRRIVREMALEYPEIEVDYMFVDNAAMQLLINPRQFDVILTENMFGDILSDEASVFCGSLGMLPSASIGRGTALFEPIHGSYPQAAGKDIANPIGSLLSTAMMLEYLGLVREAQQIRQAVDWLLANHFVTQDIDPIHFYFTSTIGDLVADFVSNKIPGVVNRENIRLRKSTII